MWGAMTLFITFIVTFVGLAINEIDNSNKEPLTHRICNHIRKHNNQFIYSIDTTTSAVSTKNIFNK